VSVVVIFLDGEAFLEEAIDSVLAQTYPHWELLLVDDGSSDGSSTIARSYAERDPARVRYLEHPGHRNLGMSAARNLGIHHARGEYLALLDADDVWLPGKLERQVAILTAHPDVPLLFGAPLYWFGWTGNPADVERDYVIDLKVETDRVHRPPDLLTAFLVGSAPPPCPSDVLIRRQRALAVGGFEERFRAMYEDQAFFAKLLLREPVFVSGECWDRYRQHSASCYAIAKRTGQRQAARHRYLRWLARYLAAQGVRSGPVREAVAQELRPFSLRTRAEAGYRRVVNRAREQVKLVARATLPSGLRTWLKARLRREAPARSIEPVRFGNLRRLTPVSRQFGWDRGGLPVDRYYIERFLERHASDIHGRVLEMRDDGYTRKFGGQRVVRADVLHPTPDNPKATIVADLTRGDELPDDTYDCVVLTQVLPFIQEPEAALKTLHRILCPGGVVLATLPGISQIIRYDMDRWGDYWRFTSLSARRLFERTFPGGEVQVQAHGNVLAAMAFLQGLSSRDVREDELNHVDPDYEVIITVRAVKQPLAHRGTDGEG
jgi:glycosyltransferase involved in cell wall biosynthesis